jgi:ribonuclease P protein component
MTAEVPVPQPHSRAGEEKAHHTVLAPVQLRASSLALRGWPRSGRLVRRSDFDAVYRQGRRVSAPRFAVFCRPNGTDCSRFGMSIRKVLGGAVIRNRIRRRTREILRLHAAEIQPGWDFVIHPRATVAKHPFPTIEVELVGLLRAAAKEGPAK